MLGPVCLPFFTFAACSTQRDGVVGELTIGGTDPKHYTGSITYVPLTANPAYWSVKLEAVYAGKDTLQGSAPKAAIIDSGTSFIVGPDVSVHANYIAMPCMLSSYQTAESKREGGASQSMCPVLLLP